MACAGVVGLNSGVAYAKDSIFCKGEFGLGQVVLRCQFVRQHAAVGLYPMSFKRANATRTVFMIVGGDAEHHFFTMPHLQAVYQHFGFRIIPGCIYYHNAGVGYDVHAVCRVERIVHHTVADIDVNVLGKMRDGNSGVFALSEKIAHAAEQHGGDSQVFHDSVSTKVFGMPAK